MHQSEDTKLFIKMKISMVFICILVEKVYIYGHQLQQDTIIKLEQCKTEIGTSAIPAATSYSQDHKEKCFHACVMEKEGMMINGKLDSGKVIAFILERSSHDAKHNMDVFKFCVDIANKENDKCEVAASMRKCTKERAVGPQQHHEMNWIDHVAVQ